MLRSFNVFDEVVQGDTHPTFTYTFEDDDAPLDISLASTNIEIKVLKPNSSLPITLSIVGKTGNPGEVFWKFKASEINVPGLYELQLRAIFSGRNYTAVEHLYLRVKEEL